MLLIPVGLAALLGGFALFPQAEGDASLKWSFLGTAALLLAWSGALALSAMARGRDLHVHIVIRRPHWMQPIVQLAIYAYWGWYFRTVYDYAWLMLANVVFAYAFDTLLAWSRRDVVELGFGPLPIIGSMGFFLLFKPDWYYLQFALIALGFVAKEFIRWQRDGRRTHIFNPSSFPLAVASVLLLLTHNTNLTIGNEIAIALEQPRYIFELVFVLAIPAQLLFGVTTMTMSAMVTTFALTSIYFKVTGTYFFFAAIPLPVFFGMLLLITDPATAPRTELGRVIYGALYGASTVLVYGVLDLLGQPTFYDKLLLVPILNLSVRAFDRFASTRAAWLDDGRVLPGSVGRFRNLAWFTIWTLVFGGIDLAEGVGDTHPGNRLPFWMQACRDDRRNGCRNLVTMASRFCAKGSGWACNEMGVLAIEKRIPPPWDAWFPADKSFGRACALGFVAACDNAAASTGDAPAQLQHGAPSPRDYAIMLEAKRLPTNPSDGELRSAACAQGWTEACATVDGPFGKYP